MAIYGRYLREDCCHAATCTYDCDKRNAMTCTCLITVPVCTSTPNCSRRSLVDCCPDVSVIENTCPHSSILASQECDPDEQLILQCSASCSSGSIKSEPDMACCEREAQDPLSRTYDLTCKTSCDKTCLSTKTSPSTLDFAKEWLNNKTCELRHKIQDLVHSPITTCEGKHVDFSSSCKLTCERSRDPSPCQSIKSCHPLDKSCDGCKHDPDPVPYCAVKSVSYVDIASKLCKLCKHVLDPAPCQPVKPCGHVDIADKLCQRCKHVLDTAPCQSNETCKYCGVADKFCKHCKYIMVSASCQPAKSFSYVDIAEKLCELCKHVLDPAPCEPDTPCKHCDISAKLCKECNHILDSAPCQSETSCKLVNVADKVCALCKLVLDPAPCLPDKPCKHCDITKKLCKDCKRILDSAPCQTDKSCRNIAIADKLCNHCKHIFNSAPCQPARSCKIIDIADKLCEMCKHVIDPVPCQLIKSCKNIPDPAPCKPINPCKHCDISKKLCKDCKRIFDSIPCADRSCKNLDIANKLCAHCRHIYDSAPCSSVKRCMKHAEIPDKSCEQCKPPPPCTPVNPCEHCDISKKLCKDCKRVFDAIPYADRSCKNLDIANKLCEHCRHIYDSAPCSSIKRCMKHVEIPDESCKQCKPGPPPCMPINPCKHCDISKKLCTECKRIIDSIPCTDRSCKNLDIANKLCEHCRHIYASAPCQLVELCKHADTAKKSCKYDLDPSPCQSVRSCKLVDIVDKSCARCKHAPDSALCQPVQSCKHVNIQMPEEGEDCKIFKELFFNDEATGRSSAELWKCGKCACALESQSAATLTTSCPIIKKETKSTCFDIAKESVCRSSGSSPESPASSCASARARYYQNKLLATLQILQNKEETVRVQAESIAVAESRIAALNARHADLRREIDRKEREIQSLRKSLKECRTCRVATCDVALTTEVQEMDDKKNIVTTLQSNLDVIEDLYRECFYESVKQESLIEMLRASCLDVRLLDREKSDRIYKLHNVINTQKWSLERCQDIATEVDNLKMEISNFINSSNNDSGMWEESVVGGLSEDLQDIAAQLLRLRDLLTGDCTCGLEQENTRLRKETECMESEISDLRTQVCVLEENLQKKDCLDRQCKEQIEVKDKELNCIRAQMHVIMDNAKEKSACCDALTRQLSETKALLDDTTRELGCKHNQSSIYEDTIKVMKEELNKSEQVTNENGTLRKEVCCVSRRAARVQRRAAELEAELARARDRCGRVEAAYREKTTNAVELERQLDEAHARGAELCAEASRVVRAVRCWAARMREMHREQEKQIKQKECKLRCLQNEMHKRQITICPRVWEQIEQGCSTRPCASAPSTTATSCSKSSKKSEGSCPTVTFCVQERRHEGTGSSGSEIASCSSTPVPHCPVDVLPSLADVPSCSVEVSPSCPANVPPSVPKRGCKKKLSACGIKRRYGWLGPFGASPQRDEGAQHPTRCDASSHGTPCGACARCQRSLPDTTPQRGPVSPGEEMFSRIESLSAALTDGYKRWSRRAPTL